MADAKPTSTFPTKSIYGAFAAFGFMSGALTGASQSPVVAPLLTGVTGIAAAVSVLWFTRKKEEAEIPDEQKGALAIGIVCFCIFTLFGLWFGMTWRKSYYRQTQNATLLDVAKYVASNSKNVPSEEITNLVLLQT